MLDGGVIPAMGGTSCECKGEIIWSWSAEVKGGLVLTSVGERVGPFLLNGMLHYSDADFSILLKMGLNHNI